MTIETVHLFVPTLAQINQELVDIINQRVIEHLQCILRDVANEHCINFQELQNKYLVPLSVTVRNGSAEK
jgi:hypothetical protein